MANLCIGVLEKLRGYLVAPDGLNAQVHAIAVRDMVQFPEITERDVALRHAAVDLLDESGDSHYPVVYLFCERVENRIERKFAKFAGRIVVVADIRVSEDTVERLGQNAARLAEAFSVVLANHRGYWTDEVAFDGRYEIKFNPITEGGVNFVQTARIEIELLGHV